MEHVQYVQLSQHQICRAAYSGLRLSCGLVRTNNCIKSGLILLSSARNAAIVRPGWCWRCHIPGDSASLPHPPPPVCSSSMHDDSWRGSATAGCRAVLPVMR